MDAVAERLIDLAYSNPGLGVTGPATEALIRRLLAAAFEGVPFTAVHMPQDTATTLSLPPNIRERVMVFEDLPSALDQLETEALRKARLAQCDALCDSQSPLLLIASIAPASVQRLQALLDSCPSRALGAVVIGRWTAGHTVHVDSAGRLTFTEPEPDNGGGEGMTVPGRRWMSASSPGTASRQFPLPETPQSAWRDAPARIRALRSPAAGVHAAEPSPESSQAPGLSSSAGQVLQLTLFAAPRLRTVNGEGPRLSVRQHEVLAYLAIHPEGVHRESLVEALWPDRETATTRRPFDALHAMLGRLRRTLAASCAPASRVVVSDATGYRLDPAVVAVDYWQFISCVTALRARQTDIDQRDVCEQIVNVYRGELGTGLQGEWLQTPRLNTAQDATAAHVRLSELLEADDPARALQLLKRATDLDPYNESLYERLIRAYARHGHPEAIPGTVDRMTVRLADLDLAPTRDLTVLADHLQHKRGALPDHE